MPDPVPPLGLRALEAAAREILATSRFDYIAGGGWDEVTIAANEAAFRERRLVPRILVDVSAVRTDTTILDAPVSAPIGFAPTALHELVHPEGELPGARTMAGLGLPFVLSTLANRTIEAVAAAAPDGVRWFQLYVNADRAVSRSLVERATAAGYRAIVVTVDVPGDGHRPRDLRNRFTAPGTFGNLASDTTYDGQMGDELARLIDASLTWDDIDTIATWSPLPIVIKGILSRTTRGSPSTTASPRSGSPTTAAASSIGRSHRWTPSGLSLTRSRGEPRSTSTAASGMAWMS